MHKVTNLYLYIFPPNNWLYQLSNPIVRGQGRKAEKKRKAIEKH